MLDAKLKAQLIVICFIHQAGFAPDNATDTEAGEIMVSGNGIGLAWSWPNVRIIDESIHHIWQDRLNDALEYFREERRKKKEDAKNKRSGFAGLSE